MGQPITHSPSIRVWVGMPRRVSRVSAVMAEVVVMVWLRYVQVFEGAGRAPSAKRRTLLAGGAGAYDGHRPFLCVWAGGAWGYYGHPDACFAVLLQAVATLLGGPG